MSFCISAILELGRSRLLSWLYLSAFGALTAVCMMVLAAGFFAPYNYETQNRFLAFTPPSRIHFIDPQRRLHFRPFVYGVQPAASSFQGYKENRLVVYPLRFLVPGAPYKLLWLIPAQVHLFGAAAGGRVFLLGTDALGRDVFSRLLFGGQISVLAALVATAISISMGLVLGGFAGYSGGWVDEMIMRIVEVFLSVPWLYLLLAIRAFLPLHLAPISVFMLLMFVSGLVGWGRPARLVRGVVLSGRNREYVLAARGFGASDLYILRTHILPQAYVVSLTQAALFIPQYITAEVSLSFFGLGVSEPAPSWGNMLAQVRTLFVLEACWWMFAPAIALVLVLVAFECVFRVQLGRIRPSG